MRSRLNRYLKKLIKVLRKPEMNILPGNIAFYFVLALIPLLTIIILIASCFSISIDLVEELVNDIFPSQVSNTIISIISGKGFDGNIGLFNIVAFAVATNGTYSIITASNTLYKVEENDVLKDRIKSVLILIIIVILLFFLLLVPILGGQILSLLESIEIFDGSLIFIYDLIKWPISFLIIYFNIKLIYAISPSKQIPSNETTYGAFFTTVIWVISTVVFSYYVTYFAKYDVLYGNLSTIIMLMIWMYVLCYVFVLGMAINATKYNNSD